jgi:hypothetical protein
LRDNDSIPAAIAASVDMSVVAMYKILKRISEAEEIGCNPLDIIKKTGQKVSDKTLEIRGVAEIIQFNNALTQKQICVILRNQW